MQLRRILDEEKTEEILRLQRYTLAYQDVDGRRSREPSLKRPGRLLGP